MLTGHNKRPDGRGPPKLGRHKGLGGVAVMCFDNSCLVSCTGHPHARAERLHWHTAAAAPTLVLDRLFAWGRHRDSLIPGLPRICKPMVTLRSKLLTATPHGGGSSSDRRNDLNTHEATYWARRQRRVVAEMDSVAALAMCAATKLWYWLGRP